MYFGQNVMISVSNGRLFSGSVACDLSLLSVETGQASGWVQPDVGVVLTNIATRV